MRRTFFDTLRDVRAGLVIEQLDESLQSLVQRVQRTGKAGSLRLTLEVKPLKGSTEAVVVRDTIVLKEPQFDNAGTVLFPTPEGNLQRSHHAQPELPGITLAHPPAAGAAPAAEVQPLRQAAG